jgi:hypothetical protein
VFLRGGGYNLGETLGGGGVLVVVLNRSRLALDMNVMCASKQSIFSIHDQQSFISKTLDVVRGGSM